MWTGHSFPLAALYTLVLLVLLKKSPLRLTTFLTEPLALAGECLYSAGVILKTNELSKQTTEYSWQIFLSLEHRSIHRHLHSFTPGIDMTQNSTVSDMKSIRHLFWRLTDIFRSSKCLKRVHWEGVWFNSSPTLTAGGLPRPRCYGIRSLKSSLHSCPLSCKVSSR